MLLLFATLLCAPFVLHAQYNDEVPIDWSRYDFIPGHQLLFYDDFTGDRIGDSPYAWAVSEGGKVEVDTLRKTMWLHADRESVVSPSNINLAQQFTIEMDFYALKDGYSGRYRVDLIGKNPDDWASLTLEPLAIFFSMSNGLTSEKAVELLDGIHHLSMQVDGGGFNCYVDYRPAITIPKSETFAASKIEVFLPGPGDEAEDDSCLFTNFLVLQGPSTFQTQLDASGKMIAYGIYFEPEKTTILPQSTPTMEELANLLKADASLNLAIECHDNEFSDESRNQQLSEDRAEAIKDRLVDEYRIPSNRLSTKGWGEGKPLGERGTVDGNKMNQRVEFIRK